MKQYISRMEPIRNSVAEIANQILVGLDEPGRVEVAWPLAAGHAVAKRTRALSFTTGKLAIAVPDKAWQQQLAALRPQLRAHLTRLTGVAVADILFYIETKGV
ncbi:MAG TPA: DciA family protein [Acidobacteriaceae bacterium]|nr:DciA family protein [Acidobacteriaceae bacterium]